MQSRRYSKFIRSIFLIADQFWLNAAFVLAYYLRFHTLVGSEPGEGVLEGNYFTLLLYANFVWLIVSLMMGVYEVPRVSKFNNLIAALVRTLFVHVLLVALFWMSRKAYYYSREMLLLTYLLWGVVMVLWRWVVFQVLREYRRLGYNTHRVIIVGFGEFSLLLQRFFYDRPDLGYRFMGIFDDKVGKEGGVLGRVDEVPAYVVQESIDEIYCSLPDVENTQVNELIEFADRQLVRVKLVPDFRGFATKQLKVDFYDSLPVFSVRSLPLDDQLNRMAKRTFDVIFSLIFLIFISSWLFPILGLLIKITSPGPIFFKQKRLGKDNRQFWCLKFRTMIVNEQADRLQASKTDRRITWLGSLLRRTSLDELPQFVNVLLGQMSIVGPRPHPLPLNERFESLIDRYEERHLVKPGITGLAQAKGFRGETPDISYMRPRVKMDRFYVDNWSLVLDVKIILLTLLNIVRGDKNAY